ncbi:MAG: phytanoyl-CoA dioxygenase family protein [Alphaproteobacteria bacterium]|nr:phytanoyl-CoA dioxygenase family protein [Alphaproteobacteria bacterium]
MLHREPLQEIAEEQVRAFEQDGAVCLRGMFSADWLAALAEDIERDKAEPGPMVRRNTPPGKPGEFFVDFQLWRRWPNCRRFVFDSPAAAIAARMLSATEVVYYHDHLLVKEPGTEECTPWHHDQPYYPVDGWQVGSIWLPLDPVDRATCVEYVAGSHRWGRWFRPRYFNRATSELAVSDDRFEDMPDIDAERPRHRFLAWDLAPGDCIFFHGLTVHGAPGNRSASRRRRAYATRWLGEDARYATRSQISPPILEHGLQRGDPMACALFPPVWPRAARAKELS